MAEVRGPVSPCTLRASVRAAKLLNKGGWVCGKMRCAGVLLALLLSLSSLSASTAEAHKERLDDNVVLLSGRKWLRSRKIMAALGHGDAAKKKDGVVEGKGPKSTGANTVHVHGEEKTVEGLKCLIYVVAGANQEADAPAEAVHDPVKRSKGSATQATFQKPRQGDTAAVAPEVFGMDYNNYNLNARHHRPINNDAPLGDLDKKP
ncbi:hypothetical protein BAE44_0012039 [Dichanthelium oligosanthes]|uniref:Uncharacterized protein n=1 Tax=Dichanthelium oligosanthes TaxID=888268 RepID=A0A1E5VPB9_9POAL|nr:hypothetical protein BAE44_0012039 [Dichanthelium oligosanthes]